MVGVRPGALEPPDRRGGPPRRARARRRWPSCRAPPALLELARIFRRWSEPRATRAATCATLVLVSTSGGDAAAPPARARRARSGPAGRSTPCSCSATWPAARSRKPWVVPWSNGRAAGAARAPAHGRGGGARGGRRRRRAARARSAQWARRALPLTVSEQGALGARRAARRAAQRPRRARAGARRAACRASALGAFGRARAARGDSRSTPPASRRAGDDGRRSPASRRASSRCAACCPTGRCGCWSARCCCPALLAALDASSAPAAAGCRWRAGSRWVAAGALPFLLAWLWLRLLGARPARSTRPPAPVLPAALPLGRGRRRRAGLRRRSCSRWRWSACAAPRSRARLARGTPGRRRRGGGAGALLVIAASSRVVWVVNPYAAGAAACPPRTCGCSSRAPGSRAARRRSRGPRASPPGSLRRALVVARLRARARRSARSTLRLAARSLVPAGGHMLGCAARSLRRCSRLPAPGVVRDRCARAAPRWPPRTPARARSRTRGPARLRRARLARRHGVRPEPMTAGPRSRRSAARPAAPCAAGSLDRPDRRRRAAARRRGADARSGRSRVSALYAQLQQGKLDDQLDAARAAPSSPPVDRRALARAARPRPPARLRRARAAPRAPTTGEPVGPASAIPRDRRLDAVVVAGTGHRRPAHGARATTPARRCRARAARSAIAGHRTTYGAPFRTIDELDPATGSSSTMPYGRFVYRSSGRGSSPPTAIWVTDRVGLRPARAVGLPPALLGRAAHRRVRAADRSRARAATGVA